jgi:hypothetical protein
MPGIFFPCFVCLHCVHDVLYFIEEYSFSCIIIFFFFLTLTVCFQDLCLICTDLLISELWTSNFLQYQVLFLSKIIIVGQS